MIFQKLLKNSNRPLIIFPQGTRVFQMKDHHLKKVHQEFMKIKYFLSTSCN